MRNLALEPKSESEVELEQSLRPKDFSGIIGRDVEKKALKIMIESAKKRGKAVDHLLFHGPPGLGKTTLSFVVANEMDSPFHITSGSAIDKIGDLASILASLEPHSILFIDEIHRLKRSVEEILYPAMEDGVLDIVIGKGPNAKTLRLDLPEFTIIGATTKLSMISSPLRDRFGMSFRLDFYKDEELKDMIVQKAKMLNISILDTAAANIAKRSRMTARIAIRILKRARDLAVVSSKDNIDDSIVKDTLELLDIDEEGLDEIDRRIIKVIIENFSNRPVGLNTIAASLSEEAETIENVYEPFLLKKGFVHRTARGRQITPKGEAYYNKFLIK